MSVAEILDECRTAVSGCQLVAFIDLDSKMVLSVSAQSKQRQERLDTLGTMASAFLPLPDDDIAKCLSHDGAMPPQAAVLLTMTETTAFVRSQAEPREALCCSCAPNASVDSIIEAARMILPDIGATA